MATNNTCIVLSPPKKNVRPVDIEDLIHMSGPLTEDAVMRTLQARFNAGKYLVIK